MGQKSAFFDYNMPITAGVFNLDSKPLYLSPHHMLIVPVLTGGMTITNGTKSADYREGDIALIGPDSTVTFDKVRVNTHILVVGIDTSHYREQFPHIDCPIFDKSRPRTHKRLLSLLLESAFALAEKNPEAYTVINENIKDVLKIALDDCQYFSGIIEENFSNPNTQAEYIGLMQNILMFINNNYTNKISLGDFSREEHLSENYMSHLIKKISGTSFKELVSFIRCRKAHHDLLNSSKRINEIAYEAGFSAPSYYKSSFEKFYGNTPDAYRKDFSRSGYATTLPDECSLLDSKGIMRDFALKHNINLSITSDRFFTMDTVHVDHYVERFHKVLSDEGSISNIDAEMNESSHEAFVNMQKEFRMNTITLDAGILLDKTSTGKQLTIATNINYLIWSKFKIRFVIHSLSDALVSAIIGFMKFYSRRFSETIDEIDFTVRLNASENELLLYKANLSEKLHEEVGPQFSILIESDYIPDIEYFAPVYDSFLLTPFAMDELFHPENWKIGIDFSLIDAVSDGGHILSGGSGLLTWSGMKKPWWHAYNLSSKLKGNVVSKGSDHIITNNNGTITILTYNTCGFAPSFLKSLKTTMGIYDAIQNKGHIREHGFQLLNTYGKYKKITYSINETACLFSKWAALEYPEYLTLEEETVLGQVCHPEVTFDTVVSNGKIDITTREDSFGVTCVVLEKI